MYVYFDNPKFTFVIRNLKRSLVTALHGAFLIRSSWSLMYLPQTRVYFTSCCYRSLVQLLELSPCLLSARVVLLFWALTEQEDFLWRADSKVYLCDDGQVAVCREIIKRRDFHIVFYCWFIMILSITRMNQFSRMKLWEVTFLVAIDYD